MEWSEKSRSGFHCLLSSESTFIAYEIVYQAYKEGNISAKTHYAARNIFLENLKKNNYRNRTMIYKPDDIYPLKVIENLVKSYFEIDLNQTKATNTDNKFNKYLTVAIYLSFKLTNCTKKVIGTYFEVDKLWLKIYIQLVKDKIQSFKEFRDEIWLLSAIIRDYGVYK